MNVPVARYGLSPYFQPGPGAQIVIVIDLTCEHGHPFEGWFRSSDDFNSQNARGLVNCPACGSHTIIRKPSAPYVNRGVATAPGASDSQSVTTAQSTTPSRQQVLQALREMASGAEDVGDRFAEEVRRVHYGETEERSLRGKASRGELEELLDEGIGVLPVPPAEDPFH